MRVFGLLLAASVALTGCAAPSPFASDETVAAVSFRNEGPSTLTLLTMLNNRTDAGAHTSLVIGASERILFDPAGSFKAAGVPERNDVLFGISPRTEQIYISAHARSTHRVVAQTIQVTPQQAELAYRLALANGPVPGAFCTSATVALLRQIPGFEGLGSTFYPANLMAEFGQLPGVETVVHRENDDPSLEAALAQLN
ncbi:hypothetical protein [Aestuariivita sp.]|jgi:hypothetical protein|uniref:hypothetical protein n=1 Tax=Aestuariivita sp. TaxID=1872407 RepID=UPI00216FB5F7|nr:hypothetical protein [Aestuariivita sp.]MCE8009212.1 hypothetical protein [Aestuariivita sp.]